MGCSHSFTKEQEMVLRIHNDKRKAHSSSSLKLNEDLCKLAENYIDKLIKDEIFSDNIYKDMFLGENVYIKKGKLDINEMCDSWYNEKNNYEKNPNKYQKNSGHFTQMIWKNTKEIGFGCKILADISYAVVYYYPPGNTLGEFENNVLIPKTD